MRFSPVLPVFLVCTLAAAAESLSLANVPGRNSFSLNGQWRVIVDPYENGYYDYRYTPFDQMKNPWGGYFLDRKPESKTDLVEYNFDDSAVLRVPGDWNSQEPKLWYYEGTVWYRQKFRHPVPDEAGRLFLHFGAVNYEAEVYLNGEKLGRHVGGFTPFAFEVTDELREGENSLVVKVDNKRRAEGVPTLNTDWWNFGGITRDVQLLHLPATFIADYQVQLDPERPDELKVSVELNGAESAGAVLRLEIPELGFSEELRTDEEGRAEASLAAPELDRWSPENPRRYELVLRAGADETREQIGFRTIRTEGSEILLNDEPVFLRGISIHEENPLRGGRAYSREDAEMLLGWARELGCNFVRLAHYPHNDHMARLADEMGLLVWAEVPVYWTIQWENPDTLANARNQLRELILRDRNRASVVVWSVANETPVSEARTRFLRTLVEDARRLDGTRLVSAAMELHPDPENPDHKLVDDPFGAHTDIISFNQYIGWYEGMPEKAERVSFEVAYDKPVIVSEFGAGALQGYRADALTRFSEEHQADLYRRSLEMLSRIPQWRGTTPWILADFHSPRRHLPGIQDEWNRKGLVGSNGEKKQAFTVLRDFYEKKRAAGAGERSSSAASP